MTRKDNVEYYAGRRAFHDGKIQSDNPYFDSPETRTNPDSRWSRWELGYCDACDDYTTGKPS